MHRHTTSWLLVVAAAALAACQKPETPEQADARIAAETNAAHGTFAAMDNDYARWYSAGQVDSLLAIHRPSAVVMPPHAPTVTGTEALRQMFTQSFQMAPGGTLGLSHEHLVVNGPIAIDRGRFTFHGAAGSPIPADSGKYLTHWNMSVGRWLIAEVMWNSDVPLPMPPAPPARHR